MALLLGFICASTAAIMPPPGAVSSVKLDKSHKTPPAFVPAGHTSAGLFALVQEPSRLTLGRHESNAFVWVACVDGPLVDF